MFELIPPSPEVKQFAERHHVRTKRDTSGELLIPGSSGHIYDHEEGRKFGVLLTFPTKTAWTFAKKKLVKAGFEIKQNADCEGTALFDPSNREQVKLAMKLAGVPRRRNLTNAQRKAASERMKTLRTMQNSLLKTPTFAAKNDRLPGDDPGVSDLPEEAQMPAIEAVRLMNEVSASDLSV